MGMTLSECAEPRFTLPEAAEAIGASPKRLRALLELPEWQHLGDTDEAPASDWQPPASPGAAVLLGPHSVMALCVASALADSGLSLADAMNAAARFALWGQPVGYWVDDPNGGPGIPRLPSHEFKEGETWLLTARGHTLIANIVDRPRPGYTIFPSLGSAIESLRWEIVESNPQVGPLRKQIPVTTLELSSIRAWLESRLSEVLEIKRPRNTRLRDRV
jgi:hypothetical protein